MDGNKGHNMKKKNEFENIKDIKSFSRLMNAMFSVCKEQTKDGYVKIRTKKKYPERPRIDKRKK